MKVSRSREQGNSGIQYARPSLKLYSSDLYESFIPNAKYIHVGARHLSNSKMTKTGTHSLWGRF